MPLRFYRRFRAGPFRINVGKRGASFSVGGKGAWITVGHHRVRESVGIPGTGLGWYESQRLPQAAAGAGKPSIIRRALWAIVGLVVIGAALAILAAVVGH